VDEPEPMRAIIHIPKALPTVYRGVEGVGVINRKGTSHIVGEGAGVEKQALFKAFPQWVETLLTLFDLVPRRIDQRLE
jgi:hypothetical protein